MKQHTLDLYSQHGKASEFLLVLVLFILLVVLLMYVLI